MTYEELARERLGEGGDERWRTGSERSDEGKETRVILPLCW